MQWSDEGLDIQSQHYRIVRLRFADHTTKGTPSPSIEGMGDTRMNGTM